MPRVPSSDTLWVENFDEFTLSHTVKEIEANLWFAIFGKNSKIQNGRHFGGGENFLKIAKSTFLDTLWVEDFNEITLSCTVPFLAKNRKFKMGGKNILKIAKEYIPQILCRSKIFCKNSKIQNDRHFRGGENFFKIAKSTFLDTLWVENLCFAIFGKNSKIQNGLHFWEGKIC